MYVFVFSETLFYYPAQPRGGFESLFVSFFHAFTHCETNSEYLCAQPLSSLLEQSFRTTLTQLGDGYSQPSPLLFLSLSLSHSPTRALAHTPHGASE